MTRFKELKRIQRAIKNSDVVDLKWAETFCRSRIANAPTKNFDKEWRHHLNAVLEVIEESSNE